MFPTSKKLLFSRNSNAEPEPEPSTHSSEASNDADDDVAEEFVVLDDVEEDLVDIAKERSNGDNAHVDLELAPELEDSIAAAATQLAKFLAAGQQQQQFAAQPSPQQQQPTQYVVKQRPPAQQGKSNAGEKRKSLLP